MLCAPLCSFAARRQTVGSGNPPGFWRPAALAFMTVIRGLSNRSTRALECVGGVWSCRCDGIVFRVLEFAIQLPPRDQNTESLSDVLTRVENDVYCVCCVCLWLCVECEWCPSQSETSNQSECVRRTDRFCVAQLLAQMMRTDKNRYADTEEEEEKKTSFIECARTRHGIDMFCSCLWNDRFSTCVLASLVSLACPRRSCVCPIKHFMLPLNRTRHAFKHLHSTIMRRSFTPRPNRERSVRANALSPYLARYNLYVACLRVFALY